MCSASLRQQQEADSQYAGSTVVEVGVVVGSFGKAGLREPYVGSMLANISIAQRE